MNFVSLHMKDTFRVLRISVVLILLTVAILLAAYAIIEVLPDASFSRDPFLGTFSAGKKDAVKMFGGLTTIVFFCVLGAIVFSRLCSHWYKDSVRYDLQMDSGRLIIVCEGIREEISCEDVVSFDVFPPNCEPTVFRSKWSSVGVIKTVSKTYKLYYIKNIALAKQILGK